MSYYIRPITEPETFSLDIVFGQSIHAEAIYTMDYDEIPHITALMCPVGHNLSMVNIIDDISSDSLWKARREVDYILEEAKEARELDAATSKWELSHD